MLRSVHDFYYPFIHKTTAFSSYLYLKCEVASTCVYKRSYFLLLKSMNGSAPWICTLVSNPVNKEVDNYSRHSVHFLVLNTLPFFFKYPLTLNSKMKTFVFVLVLISNTSFLALAQDGKLFDAVSKNDMKKVEKLLSKNANPNVVLSMGMMQLSPLIQAVINDNLEIIKLLVEHKAQVDWRDGFNSTALMYAASMGKKEIVEYLLLKGADAKAEDGTGNSVLTAAKGSQNAEVIALIENKVRE